MKYLCVNLDGNLEIWEQGQYHWQVNKRSDFMIGDIASCIWTGSEWQFFNDLYFSSPTESNREIIEEWHEDLV